MWNNLESILLTRGFLFPAYGSNYSLLGKYHTMCHTSLRVMHTSSTSRILFIFDVIVGEMMWSGSVFPLQWCIENSVIFTIWYFYCGHYYSVRH